MNPTFRPWRFAPGLLLVMFALGIGSATAQPRLSPALPAPLTFTVRTADGLDLPARVTRPQGVPKKVIVFINGSTP